MSLFGSSKPSWTTTAPPSWVSGVQQGMFGQFGAALQPYMQGGNWNADQNRAFELIRQQAENPAVAEFAPMEAAQLSPTAYKPFMNPYTKEVINTTLQTTRDELERDLHGVRSRTAAASAFGGTGARGAIQESQLTSDYGKRRDALVAQLRAQGFSDANARAFANVQLQQQANQFNAAGLNAARSNALTARSSALAQLLGIGNQQFEAPLQAARIYGAMIPQQYGSTETKSAPQGPSTLQQILGVGGSILGASMGPGGATLGGMLATNLFPSLFGNKGAVG